jgi:hypothetical protein
METGRERRPDWAWALYLDKVAIGVGQKNGVIFT